jgi:hypothetical protein
MSADDIVNVSITLQSKAPTAAGFGRPLILTYHTKWLARTKRYTASAWSADMITDGFVATDETYRLVQAVFSQKPAPPDVKVGRRALAFTQIVNLAPPVTTQGFIYSGEINGLAWTYTVGASATVATVSTAIAAAINALAISGLTASGASTTHVACTAIAGNVFRYSNMVPELRVADVTTDPGIATDLAAVVTADNDWFGLLIDSNSKAEILAAAAYIETQRKWFCAVSADYACKDGASTTDVMYSAKALAYFNTSIFYYHDAGSSMAAGAMGKFLPTVVGQTQLAHQLVTGVAPSDTSPNGSKWITDAESAAVQAKNGNVYVTLGSQGDIMPGKVAGGDFVDTVRGIHFMHARIQEMYIGKLQADGYRMTNAGISKANNDLKVLLDSWTKKPHELLDPDPEYAPTVTTPTVAELSASDKATRHLPDVEFGARVQGGIITIDVRGKVTV